MSAVYCYKVWFFNFLIIFFSCIWLFWKKTDDKAFIFVNHTFITLGIVSFEQNFECVACIFTIFKENWIVTNGFLWASVVSKVKKIHYCSGSRELKSRNLFLNSKMTEISWFVPYFISNLLMRHKLAKMAHCAV